MNLKPRIAVALLTLSATAFVGIATREGYTETAIIPTKGDVPTVGFGSTVKEDGSRVKMGDRTTPVQAVQRTLVHIQKDESVLKKCMGDVELYPKEWDMYVDLSHNVGSANFCYNSKRTGPSTIVTRLRAKDYVGACEAILLYKYAAGYDCSTPGNKRCYGVWTDRLNKHKQCLEAAK